MNRLGWATTAVAIVGATFLVARIWSAPEFGSGEASRTSVVAGNGHRPTMRPSSQAGASKIDGLGKEFSLGPLSLHGTEPDGALSVDDKGHFVPNSDALAFFDYFLTATGEMSESDLRNYIVSDIRRKLNQSAASDAERLLDRYLIFRRAVRDLVNSGVAPHGVERRWQWIRELRREHFGAEIAAALFGESEEVEEEAAESIMRGLHSNLFD